MSRVAPSLRPVAIVHGRCSNSIIITTRSSVRITGSARLGCEFGLAHLQRFKKQGRGIDVDRPSLGQGSCCAGAEWTEQIVTEVFWLCVFLSMHPMSSTGMRDSLQLITQQAAEITSGLNNGLGDGPHSQPVPC